MMLINLYFHDSPSIVQGICTAFGFLALYTEWIKLLFTMWVTFHLFCFAVLHKNLKKLEVLYVVTSLLLPAFIATVPLITDTYGLDPGGYTCYIYANTSVAFIEILVLWDGPAMLLLIAASIAIVVMVIKLASQVCRRSVHETITDGDQFWKALKQLLPLAAFPALFFILQIPVLISDLTSQYSTPNEGMLISASLCFALWSMSSGATVVIHISLSQINGKKPIKPVPVLQSRHLFKQLITVEESGSHAISATHFSVPPPSV